MSDFPDYIALVPDPANMPAIWPGFPHRLALLPDGRTLDELRAAPCLWGIFLMEPGSMGDVLNGTALPGYLKARAPVVIHARRARDLRPFLRRADALARRGYTMEVLSTAPEARQ